MAAGLCGGGMRAVSGRAVKFPVALSFFPNAREQCFKEKLFLFRYALWSEHSKDKKHLLSSVNCEMYQFR